MWLFQRVHTWSTSTVSPPPLQIANSSDCCRWGYAVLDEGHRIRNSDAEVTLMAKQLQTVHRCKGFESADLIVLCCDCLRPKRRLQWYMACTVTQVCRCAGILHLLAYPGKQSS